ncbi:MAG: zinc metallopeptidase [Oscillospiraceae bacterium]|nr:zinc metallopeptidase [Oscillospiraceae bacterium]
MFYMDQYYLTLILPAMIIAMIAQSRVQSSFQRYSRVASRRGITGAQAARRILDAYGLNHVQIQHIAGNLSDHYDPTTNVVRLSDSVYGSTSIASIGVAAHEVGHAIQHAHGYFPIKVRTAIIPITNLGSNLSMPLLLAGILFSAPSLVNLGIILFSTMTVFQLVTLPVEFNASSRALAILEQDYILEAEELDGAKKVLSAAAMTYVAALITSAAQLLRLVLLFGGRRNDD